MHDHPFSMQEINQVLLEKQGKLWLPPDSEQTEDNSLLALTMMRNLEDLGFIFSKPLFERLKMTDDDMLVDLYTLILPVLKKMIGAHITHQPFYPNFPQQLAAMSDLEIYLNAIIHYWTIGKWSPEAALVSRFPLVENKPQIRTIELGSFDDFNAVFTSMMQARGSLSESDRNLLAWFIQRSNENSLASILPELIPSKETLSIIAGNILTYHPDLQEVLGRYFKTATDILRLAAAMSAGDVSLSASTRFNSLARAERRFLLSLLERCANIEEDMARYPGKWIRLGEILHPGDYTKKYPKTYQAFQKIRNEEKIDTFTSRVEKAIGNRDIETALILLKQRPGELARRLDHLLRIHTNHSHQILDTFSASAGDISSQVLLQVLAHFQQRNNELHSHSYFPKGDIAKVQVIERTLLPIPQSVCEAVVRICEQALLHQLSKRPLLGKVYIDPALKNVIVPLAQRSASKSLRSFARGSRFNLGENARTIRAFIHWKNISRGIPDRNETDSYIYDYFNDFDRSDTRIDVDLSVGLYDEAWQFLEQVSYTNIRSDRFPGLYHSGDIIDAPQGASEFIDMDIDNLKHAQVRYAVFNIYSYSRQGFNEIPECFFGWMEREEPGSGEVFEAETVVSKADLTSPTTICLPVLFDLQKKEFLWLDLALKSNPNWVNNIHANCNNVVRMARALVEKNLPNLYDLFKLNAQARGELVQQVEEADISFGLDDTMDVTPFDVELILSDFL